MRHLTPEQALTNLRLGKTLEQWLGPSRVGEERTLRWVEVTKEPEGYRVGLYEGLDDDERAAQGLYQLYSPVRDPKWGGKQFVEESGTMRVFDDPQAALDFVATCGGSPARFVNKDFLRDEYLDWRRGAESGQS